MKNRQFISILAVILVWFLYILYKIDSVEQIVTNVDKNVATVDERVLDMSYKIQYIIDSL